MTTIESRISTQAKRAKHTTSAKADTVKVSTKLPSNPAANKDATSEELHTTRVTKHDRILTLLRRREGATIPEMMEASGWQQHSVRGFLAGTVKRKMCLALVSSKTEGDVRRYRIAMRRGR